MGSRSIAATRRQIQEAIEKHSLSGPMRTERELLLADAWRPQLPQEHAIAQSGRLRTNELRYLVKAFNNLTRLFPSMGLSRRRYHAGLATALALIDADLPYHLCPLCRNRMPKKSCVCEGRGWFSKAQKSEFFRACLRNSRPAPEVRAIDATSYVASDLSRKIPIASNVKLPASAAVQRFIAGLSKVEE